MSRDRKATRKLNLKIDLAAPGEGKDFSIYNEANPQAGNVDQLEKAHRQRTPVLGVSAQLL